ncbi:MAG: DUF998 domain-containing protein [Candidatus Bathyarchaeia archaeon]
MNDNNYALLGVIAPLTAYIFVGTAVTLSPWFSWQENALSDLGHAINSNVAAIFNFGLLLTGFLIGIYSVTAFRKYAKYSSVFLLISAFSLQLVATFNETYCFVHFAVSMVFFILIGTTLIVYSIEKRSFVSITAFIIGIGSWILYWANPYSAGIAVPEAISSLSAASWVIFSAFKIYLTK